MTFRTLSVVFCFLAVAGCGDSTPLPESPSVGGSAVSSADSDDQFLSDAVRRHVWDIEHFGFVIEATVFPKLKSSFNDGSMKAWTKLLATDCRGAVPLPQTIKPSASVAGGKASFGSTIFASKDLTNGSGQQFLDWLKGLRANYAECKSSLGLVRLIPDSEDLTGEWTSVWRLRISGTDRKGPVETEVELKLRLTKLIDDIADEAGWSNSIEVLSHQHMSATQPFFVESTKSSGLESDQRHDNWKAEEFVPNTGGVYVTDYNLDGHLDVLVDDHTGGNRLYRGRGDGTFEDTTEAAGIDPGGRIRAWALSCWADLDNDGDDDLIVEDKLYENLGDGRFSDITSKTNFPLTPATSYAVADYNLDGLLDVYVCHSDAYRVGQTERARVKWIDDGLGIDNVLLKNLGNWQFADVTAETDTGAQGITSFTALWLHANDDDRPDLFAINEFGVNALLINREEGKFEPRTVDPVFGGFSMGAAAGDFNNDGRTDIYVANMYSKAGNRILANVDRSTYPAELYRKIEEGTLGSKLYAAGTDGSFRTVDARNMFAYVGWAYGPTFADFDNDGWLDIYATAGFKSEERGKPDG